MRRRLKIAFDLRLVNIASDDVPKHWSVIEQAIKKNNADMLRKKSMRVLKWRVQYGYVADDIIQNTVTVVCSGWGFKVPRIIKSLF
jgi:hypothetical protein